jgi:hypothetical protein
MPGRGARTKYSCPARFLSGFLEWPVRRIGQAVSVNALHPKQRSETLPRSGGLRCKANATIGALFSRAPISRHFAHQTGKQKLVCLTQQFAPSEAVVFSPTARHQTTARFFAGRW